MSAQAAAAGGGKKAVHVKWAGKTIALGTFSSGEADEKCARAKALTRAWRSTMRPKPTREWVMAELERLGVRVVSGRLGRKAGEEDEPSEKKPSEPPAAAPAPAAPAVGTSWPSSISELDNIIQQRRNSSLGLSMMSDRDFNRRGSLGSLGGILGFEPTTDPTVPPHRPLVGGGSAAAYEAARADHYQQKREEQVRRASLSLAMGGGSVPMGGLSVNPNQHYEMLKLHHMNLLNEIQETTLMMNLYQQQQLQQQQQQLQQRQASVEGLLPGTSSSKRGSLGLGSVGGDSTSEPAPKKAKSTPSAASKKDTEKPKDKADDNEAAPDSEKPTEKSDLEAELLKSQKEQEALEAKLKKIKEDIARREKEAEELQKKADDVGAGSKPSNADDEKKDESDTASTKEEKKVEES